MQKYLVNNLGNFLQCLRTAVFGCPKQRCWNML